MDKILFEIIPDVNDIERSMQLAREYDMAFEYNDFMMPQMLDQREACRERISFYKSLGRDRSRDTMHGAFLDIVVHSEDSLIREASKRRVYQSMEIAAELGIRGVVFHTGLLSNFRADHYRKQWLEKNIDFWTRVLKDFPQQQVYIENMFERDGDMCEMLGRSMEREERFGLCLDYGHAMAFGDRQRIGERFCRVAPYIRHMHINDNNLEDDLHLPMGTGEIDWEQFLRLMGAYKPRTTILLEVKGYEAQKKSLEYMERIWRLN